MKPFAMLAELLSMIEEHPGEAVDVNRLAASLCISSVHLQRIFKFAFGLPLSGYLRSRRLTASLETLLKTDLNVIDIANEYGYEYEQSYIRAFKREFGCSPGELRKNGQIVKVTPPIQLFDANKLGESIFFGPEIVMVPAFHMSGKRYKIPYEDSASLAPEAAKEFWSNERERIGNTLNPDVFIGLTRIPPEADFSYYLPAVQVRELKSIPDGLEGDTFDTSLCAKFHYIGQHHYYDINSDIASEMYKAAGSFMSNEKEKYTLPFTVFFERIDTAAYDGTYCQMEWYTPIIEKIREG